MITWYNHAYYATHFEQLGYVTEKEYIESKFPQKQKAEYLTKLKS
jgi:hypothetical protein